MDEFFLRKNFKILNLLKKLSIESFIDKNFCLIFFEINFFLH